MNNIIDRIHVIDTETTDIRGATFGDLVVEIGVAEVDLVKRTVRPFFGSVCGYDITKWDERKKKAWVFEHTDLTLDDVANAPRAEEVAEDLRAVLGDAPLTAFNVPFDFERFLRHAPWCIECKMRVPDIMMVADTIEEIPRSKYDPNTGWRAYPNAENTYNYLFGQEDPAGINHVEKHRALSDAVVEGYILLELYKRGLYKVPKVIL